ncbi:MAG: sulfatase [Phycisphaerales bacterium]|nr:MAG: sulfatase [Phycisphaerales bacterium]
MNRREFIKKAGLGAAGLIVLGRPATLPAASIEQPSILLVIGDDMVCRDCEPYGNDEVSTPNITRLAREGMCFDAMFTSTAMCAPTRQQLYTGVYPVRNGAYPNHSRVYDGVKSLPHYLKSLGYRVGLIGKRHFGPPDSFPFETVGRSGGKNVASDVEAITEFVNRDKRQPYCLVVASNEPHTPWNRGDAAVYNPEELTVPPYLVDCPETRQSLPPYYAEITYLDGQLGSCMHVVDESGQRDDTIVIFTSEQGSPFPFGGKWSCYDTGLKTAFIVRWPAKVKAGTRTAAMTQYVDVVPTVLEAAGANPDEIETGRPDAHGKTGFDGRSFLNVLLGRTETHRDHVYGAHTTRGIINGSGCYPIRSVRSARYKYIRNLNHEAVFYNVVSTSPTDLLHAWIKRGETEPAIATRARFYQHRPAEELYDLDKDPYELKNLAENPKYAKIKNVLKGKLELWMRQQGDEGVTTELSAIERQGPNRKWTPYDPSRPSKANVRKRKRRSVGQT